MSTSESLAAVRRAAARKRYAMADYRLAIAQARADGASYRAIADAAGTKPPTIVRTIQRHTKGAQS